MLLIVASTYLGCCLLAYVFQRRFVYYPDRNIIARPSDIGLDYEDLRLQTADGYSIAAWFLPAHKGRNVILFCHGNGGNISHRLTFAQILHDQGYSILLFDYRGYGESEGVPSEEGTYADAMAAWDYLTQRKGFSSSDIVIQGRSLGGAVAANLASQVKPSALILESTFTSLPDIASDICPVAPVRMLLEYSYDTNKLLPGISVPLLILHSRDDELIPFRHGQSLFATAHEPKTFVEISGDHNQGYLISGRKYLDALKAFLASTENQP